MLIKTWTTFKKSKDATVSNRRQTAGLNEVLDLKPDLLCSLYLQVTYIGRVEAQSLPAARIG